ncbi:MAG: substrate-binding domain-containing protein [Victivallaceae bacterium]|jgi:DNA-binding LacI/PurR family transcriptional regulator
MNLSQEKIYNYLLDNIAEGKFGENARIPTESELSKSFDTNRMNAHFAIKELERFGILRRNKKQGTFVNRVPRPYSFGELKSVTTRRVCVLNHCNPLFQHIHWNDRIMSALESVLKAESIEMVYRDISGINELEDYRRLLKELVCEGCNALLIVADQDLETVISQYPEIFFEFHNDVFIFDRGISNWLDWPYNIVSVNVFGDSVMVADYLLSKGLNNVIFCRRAGFESFWLRERLRGLEFGFKRGSGGNRKLKVLEIIKDGKSFAKGNDCFIKELESKSVVLIAQNDEVAALIVDIAKSHSLTAGKDFMLISFDDNSKYREYNLTTVSPSLEKIGRRLGEMIKKNINNENSGETVCIKIDSELIVRETC